MYLFPRAHFWVKVMLSFGSLYLSLLESIVRDGANRTSRKSFIHPFGSYIAKALLDYPNL